MKDFLKTLASNDKLKRKVIRASLFFILGISLIIAIVLKLPTNEPIDNNVTENQISSNHIPAQKTIIEDKKTVYDFAANEQGRVNREKEIAGKGGYFTEEHVEVTKEQNNPYQAPSDPFADYEKKRNTPPQTRQKNPTNTQVKHSQYGNSDMWTVENPKQQEKIVQNIQPEVQPEQPKPRKQSKKDIFERGAMGASKSSNFSASIRGTQDLKAGQILRFQTDEEFFIDGEKIPKNTSLSGVLSISKYRADIYIQTANINGKIVDVNLYVYGSDGIKGIPIYTDEPIKDAKDQAVNEVTRSMRGGSGVVGTAAGILGGVLSSKAKDPVVKFIDNQKVILVHSKNRF